MAPNHLGLACGVRPLASSLCFMPSQIEMNNKKKQSEKRKVREKECVMDGGRGEGRAKNGEGTTIETFAVSSVSD